LLWKWGYKQWAIHWIQLNQNCFSYWH
jgi:hypothetical protein